MEYVKNQTETWDTVKRLSFILRKVVSFLEMYPRCIVHPWGKRKAKRKHRQYISEAKIIVILCSSKL